MKDKTRGRDLAPRGLVNIKVPYGKLTKFLKLEMDPKHLIPNPKLSTITYNCRQPVPGTQVLLATTDGASDEEHLGQVKKRSRVDYNEGIFPIMASQD